MNLTVFCVLSSISVKAATCPGCVDLDELTFDKIVKRFSAVLVKFDIAYPYGEKHEVFAKFSEQITPQIDDFLVAAVGIKDYGEKDNSKLADRYNVGDQYPVLKLYKNGNPEDYVDYPKGERNFILNSIWFSSNFVLVRFHHRFGNHH